MNEQQVVNIPPGYREVGPNEYQQMLREHNALCKGGGDV